MYDGDCPVCMAEVKLLKSRDKDHKIAFVDISADDYDPDENEGVTFEEASSPPGPSPLPSPCVLAFILFCGTQLARSA